MLLAAAGLLLLAGVSSRIGWHSVLDALAAVRAGIAIIVLLSVIRLALQTLSWSIALRQDGVHAGMRELMMIRLASQGIGYLTVLGPVASEPMKISLLRKYSRSSTAATLVDTGVYWFTSGLVSIAGCLAAAMLLAHRPKSVASAAILSAILIAVARSKILLTRLGDSLGARCPKWLRKAGQIEIAIRNFAQQDSSAIRRMLLLDLGCQVLVAAELATVLWLLSLPLHAGTILGLEAANRMVKMFGGWLPARIGADEGGAAAAFVSFGLPSAAGLALALSRRTRDLLASLVGLTWLAWMSRRRDGSVSPEVHSFSAHVGGI
jgi:hypothetical protein